jgi:carboxymethylenebutenolidase
MPHNASAAACEIPGPEGAVDGVLCAPTDGAAYPGVLYLTDIGGVRAPQTARATRLAAEGYVVYVPNVFYRTRRPPMFDFPRDMKDERTRTRFAELTTPLTPEAMARDAGIYVEWLSGRARPGGLATDLPTSPHRLLEQVRARLYFGHAVEDASMPAAAIARLEEALATWGGVYRSETYEGARHGWTASDSPAFNPDQAERAFRALTTLLGETLRARAPA